MLQKILKDNRVAEFLNVNRSKAYGIMNQGEVPIVKNRKCVRLKEEDGPHNSFNHFRVQINSDGIYGCPEQGRTEEWTQ